MITLQYLEPSPHLSHLSSTAVLEKLRRATEILPITHLLIGWKVPPPVLEACRREAERLGLRFLRWQPLLTGDGIFRTSMDCQVMNTIGKKVPGFGGLPHFTFACPNNPAVQGEIETKVAELAREGLYHGFFLDRIRFPSPSQNIIRDLGCFCDHCQKRAAEKDLDLEQVRRSIVKLAETPEGRLGLAVKLLGGKAKSIASDIATLICAFLDFRQDCITDFVSQVSTLLRKTGMEIGLDCFSPSLTRMVGQDLAVLGRNADWVKVMTYAHTHGPAGIPFELVGFYDYLSANTAQDPSEVMHTLGEAVGFDLPATPEKLNKEGISSSTLSAELRRGVMATSSPLLAGLELVEIPGVVELHNAQILADLQAVRRSGVAGIALSWDLWHIPLERLAHVRQVFH